MRSYSSPFWSNLNHLKLLLTTLSRFSIHYKFTITFISHEVTELQNHSVCAFSFSSRIISFNSFRITSSGAFCPVHNSIWAALWNWTYQDHSGFCSPSSQHFSGMRSWTGCSRHQNKTVLAWLVQIFVYGFLYCPWFCVLSPYWRFFGFLKWLPCNLFHIKEWQPGWCVCSTISNIRCWRFSSPIAFSSFRHCLNSASSLWTSFIQALKLIIP